MSQLPILGQLVLPITITIIPNTLIIVHISCTFKYLALASFPSIDHHHQH